MKGVISLLVALLLMGSASAYYVSVRDNTFVPAYSLVGIAAGRQVVKSLSVHPRQVMSDEIRGSNFRPETFYLAWGVHKGVVVPSPVYLPVTVGYDHSVVSHISNAEQRDINPLNRRSGAYIGRYGL